MDNICLFSNEGYLTKKWGHPANTDTTERLYTLNIFIHEISQLLGWNKIKLSAGSFEQFFITISVCLSLCN